jgi:hypothetical protein
VRSLNTFPIRFNFKFPNFNLIVLIITNYELNTGALGSHESIKQKKIIRGLHKLGMADLYKKLYKNQKQSVQVTCMPLYFIILTIHYYPQNWLFFTHNHILWHDQCHYFLSFIKTAFLCVSQISAIHPLFQSKEAAGQKHQQTVNQKNLVCYLWHLSCHYLTLLVTPSLLV